MELIALEWRGQVTGVDDEATVLKKWRIPRLDNQPNAQLWTKSTESWWRSRRLLPSALVVCRTGWAWWPRKTKREKKKEMDSCFILFFFRFFMESLLSKSHAALFILPLWQHFRFCFPTCSVSFCLVPCFCVILLLRFCSFSFLLLTVNCL